MNTNEFYKLLNEYLDNTISSEDLTRLMQAVSTDSRYKEEFEGYSELSARAGNLPKGITPPPAMWDNIEARLSKKGSSFVKVTDNFYTFTNLDKNNEEYKQINQRRSLQLPVKYIATGLIAATLIIALVFGLKNFLGGGSNSPEQLASIDTYWMVSNIKGTPTVDDKAFTSVDSVKIGEWLVTDDSSQALLKVSNIGTIVVDPGSKIKIIKSDIGEHRIILEYGTISADIYAPPRTFFVETPSMTAVDLGCSYSLSMDKQGDGILYVKEGMVELKSDKRETLVPAGKYCLTKKGVGPGTPYREDSSPELKSALLKYDFKGGGAAALNMILNNAKKTDAVTLLNLLPYVDGKNKEKVYAKLSKLVQTPRNIPRDSIYYFNYDKMNEWIDKITVEVNREVAKINKEIIANMQYKFNFDSLKFSDEMRKEFEFEMKELHKELEESMKELEFDKEEFKRDMEEMKKELKENLKDKEFFNSEEFKRDMEEMQKELQENQKYFDSEEFKMDMEKMNKEIQKSVEESMKNMEYFNSEEFQRELNEEIQRELEKELKENEKELNKNNNKDKKKDSDEEDESFEYEFDDE